jgi:hypothetical protein
VLLRTANREALVENISEEVGNFFTKEQILKYYNYTCKIPFGALIINVHSKP